MGMISPSMRGTPWFEDGNILISSGDGKSVFKLYTGLLMYSSAHFEERLSGLSSDTTEIIDNCEKIDMDKDDSARDLSHFFQAIHCGITITSLDSSHDLTTIASILRLATKYGAHALHARAVAILRVHFPSTLSAFNLKISSPTSPFPQPPDLIIVINIARETSSFMLLPAAMALLTNNTSAREVFEARLHATTPPHILIRDDLNTTDALKFALVKELHQVSITKLLNFMRSVATGCCQPPDMSKRCTRTAPVGYITLAGTPSICVKTLNIMADDLALNRSRSENPTGYLDFVTCVRKMTIPKSQICWRCRRKFEVGLEEHQLVWWNTLPVALGFSGWGDDRLHDLGV